MIDRRGRNGLCFVLLATGLGQFGPSHARADLIALRGGGEVKGVILPDSTRPNSVVIQTENSTKPLVFARDQVLGVTREPGPLDDYLKRRSKIADLAQAQYDFGMWCESNKLFGPAHVHFQKALELDKNFIPVRKKLGHVEKDGKWFTFEELRQAQGLVLHKGRWITPQEKERLEAKAVAGTEQASWTKRIKLLRAGVLSGSESRRQQAEVQLAAIKDPAAVTPLMNLLSDESESVRLLLAQILGGITGPEATSALVSRILAEPEISVRRATIDEYVRRDESNPSRPFLKALTSKDQLVVGRAASALAALKVTSAVPKLVNTLVYTEKRVVLVPNPAANSGGQGYGFSSVTPGSPMIGNGSSYAMSTGPVVGNGVVAFGAAAVPYAPNSTGLSVGGGLGGGNQPAQIPQVINYFYQNPDVLEALQALTGVNFGYDVASWKQWVSTSFRPESPVPPRRVPQP
jgi:HEAT repeats